jgi:hypothetical protein
MPQEYAALVDSLVASTGIPRKAIVDIRGNHDAFDVGFAGDDRDFYSEYSSHGTRCGYLLSGCQMSFPPFPIALVSLSLGITGSSMITRLSSDEFSSHRIS